LAGSFSIDVTESGSADLLLDTALGHELIVLELAPLFAD
jgi:hypothetical protein